MNSSLRMNSQADTANRQRRFNVNIAVYMQISFGQASEVGGKVGSEHFSATSKKETRGFRVDAKMGGVASQLVFKRRLRGGKSVSGVVMGQAVVATLKRRRGSVTVDGYAGDEPIRFYLDMTGRIANWSQDIGLTVIYQSLFSEISGNVDRAEEAVMAAMLVPVLIYRQSPEQF